MVGRLGVTLFACWTYATFAAASDFSVTATLSSHEVAVGEEFFLTVEISGKRAPKPDGIELPEVSGIDVVSQSSQYRTEIINMAISQSRSVVFTMVANREGAFTIPSIPVKIGKTEIKTTPLPLRVTTSGRAGPGAPSYRPPSGARPAFIDTRYSKGSVYVGEAIAVQYRLLFSERAYPNTPQISNLSIPTFEGFESFEIPTQPVIGAPVELDSLSYRPVPLKTVILFPALSPRSGTLQIEPLSLRLLGSRDLFDDFFSWDPFNRRRGAGGGSPSLSLRSDPLSIQVAPLPPVPANLSFSQSVGQFTIEAIIAKPAVDIHEAITLEVVLRGSGRILNAPVIDLPDRLERYDPTVQSSSSVSSGSYREEKRFTYLLIPKEAGECAISKIEYTFFDPEEEAYRTIAADPLTVSVTGVRAASAANPAAPAVSRIPSSALRFIKPNRTSLESSARGTSFYVTDILQAALAGLTLLAVLWIRFKPGGRVTPVRTAVRALSDVERLSKKDPVGAALRLDQTLHSFLAERFSYPASAVLTREELDRHFDQARVPADLRSLYYDFKGHSESLRWGGGTERVPELFLYLKAARALISYLGKEP